MKLERLLIVSAAAVGVAGLLALNLLIADEARQGDGLLSQEPMHLGATVPPNFIMAIDDSGSMTFQTMFPGTDGEACWSNGSFFDGTSLRTSGSCDYFYVLPGPRVNNYYGIPPFDQFGFARSPDFNPTYYSPDVKYDPWIRADTLVEYTPASIGDTTLIDVRKTDTANLFGSQYVENTNDDFRVQDGMTIPSGTEYGRNVTSTVTVCTKYDRNGKCTKTEDQTTTTWTTAATTSAFNWSGGAKDIYIKYKPAVFFLKTERVMAGYSTAVKIDNACGTGCALYKYEPTQNDTKQNFANWFSFYGNRNRAMVAGLTRSLSGVDNMRVGYFTINSGGGSHAYADITMHDLSQDDTNHTAKKALLNQVIPLKADGGTPNRYAVAHIGAQFEKVYTVAKADKGTSKDANIIQHACQKNAGMLFTDGYSNDGGPGALGSDAGLGVPFEDAHADTMADVAAYYYNTQLRKNDFVAGKVPLSDPKVCAGSDAVAKRGVDCNANLHMNFYGITLGARGAEFGVRFGLTADGKRDGALATQQALKGPTYPTWQTRTDNNPNTVDEIWHATMNARGQYINAQTPADITNAMRNVLASVGVGGGVSGSLAITGSRLGDGSLSVTPRFNKDGTDWYGDIVASKPSQTKDASGKSKLTYTTIWSASEKLPAAASRNIYFGTNATAGNKPVVDKFYSSGPGSLADLCINYGGSKCGPSTSNVDLLDVDIEAARHYLAGDDSLEGTKLRERKQPLGDIVNSTPIVSAPTDDYGYALIRKSDTFEYDPYKYSDYLDTKSKRQRMVYVGANDGMLHAFNGASGKEEFAYIPSAVVGYLGNLLFPKSPEFQHRYLVDGPVVVSDARLQGSWKTVVVGTAGAGARSVFGLDVTSATDFSGTDVLWEINDRIAAPVGDRIGYVLGKPVIVPVRGTDGTPVWKAIFGGGYGNRLQSGDSKGTVTLFVVDMATGDVDYIDAKETGSTAVNGLGNVVAIDRYQHNTTANGFINGSDGMVDTVYAGDLQGNIWKFDLTKTGDARVAFGGKPLFRATDGTDAAVRQAITGGLEAAVGPRGGVMVLFGTGSFSYTGDKMNTDVQTVYGVLDMPNGATTYPLTRTDLRAQTMDKDGVVTNTNVNYFTQRGWYLDLGITDGKFQAKGERMVGYPKIEGGTLYFTTYAPNEGDACSGGGSNYLYGLSTLSGGGNLGIVKVGSPDANSMGEGTGRLTLTTEGSAPVKDVSVFTTGKQGGLGGTPDDAAIAKYGSLDPEYCMAIVSVAGSDPLYRVRPCGRQSWRQIR